MQTKNKSRIKESRQRYEIDNREIIFLVEESPEGGYEARAIGHSIFTQGDTMDELKKAIKEAVLCHFSSKNPHLIIRIHLVKDEVMAL